MSTATDPAPPVERAQPGNGDCVDLEWLLDVVRKLDCTAADAKLIDRIAALERLKSGCAAAQARLTATFADSRTADGAARRQRPDGVRRSIAGQVGLARRDSPHAGRRHVGVAAALVTDMPHTLAALGRGELSERRARVVVEQLACLTPTDRREADRLLAPELAGLGDQSAQTRAAAIAYRLDPETVMGKVRGAVKDRHVSLRPAPDTMSRFSALLPVTLGVAMYAALCRSAAAATAAPGGDPRNRGQLMADALVSAVTGRTVTGCDPYGVPHFAPITDSTTPAPQETPSPQDTNTKAEEFTDAADTDDADTDDADADLIDGPSGVAAATAPAPAIATPLPTPGVAVVAGRCAGGCGISINLIMTDRTLLDSDDEPAHLTGHGPIPAALARALVIGAADTTTRTFIRRLYTDPITGQLATMDTRRRLFPPAAQRFLLARDQTCRTPWCDAPIREHDHVDPHAHGGPTSTRNGQGVCIACNLTKAAPDWSARSCDGTIQLTTPTGHTYRSTAPPAPRSTPWADISHAEHRLAKILLWSA